LDIFKLFSRELDSLPKNLSEKFLAEYLLSLSLSLSLSLKNPHSLSTLFLKNHLSKTFRKKSGNYSGSPPP
jgi:mRNA-degrading endonuclease RelE of RelBE toxin-antitoxin system